MWEKLKRWWREDFMETHHKGCGGRWREVGTSGYAVLVIHFRCEKCRMHGEYLHSPAFSVACVDTTGAGDAFHGGFIYGLLAGFSIEETLRFSNAVAALKCRQVGARTGLPGLAEVTGLLGLRP